jgi:uncharacterized repeat protein (TIGR03809 family)
MDSRLQLRGIEDVARRWHALAERRQAHFDELQSSGRWRKYYREYNFTRQMQETARLTEAWQQVVLGNGVALAKANGFASKRRDDRY